jgi:hypothetical protein
MKEEHILFLKALALDKKFELMKARRDTGGSNADDVVMSDCDEVIEELEKLLKKS